MILAKIIAEKKNELAFLKKNRPAADLKKQADSMTAKKKAGSPGSCPGFAESLSASGASLIAEVKKASPSRGVIAENFNPAALAREYQEAGAAAVSVLTDEKFFQGSLQHLKEVAAEVDIPVLRKDFIIEEYQLYRSKIAGAQAVLLIVGVLQEKLPALLLSCRELGLESLVEVHTEKELQMALGAGAEVIGINNRNLSDFSIDLDITLKLSEKIPEDRVIIAESGITTSRDIASLKDHVSGFLIGEVLMKAEDKSRKIEELFGSISSLTPGGDCH